jgi:hypothetical protein
MATNSLIDQLVDEPVPTSLESWAFQAISASFPAIETAVVWGGVLQYLGWLDSLPVAHPRYDYVPGAEESAR